MKEELRRDKGGELRRDKGVMKRYEVRIKEG